MPEILNTIQSSILLNLKSDEADTINGSDVPFMLNTPIQALPGNRILLNWVSVEIPNSQYLVNEMNNTLSFTIDGVVTTLVFPNGNYTITSFKEKLEELWTASHATTALTVDFNELSLKYVLTFQKTGLIIITVDYKKSSILKIIGFDTSADTSVVSSESLTVELSSKIS